MQPALETVFRRGAVFLWPEYSNLDDPALAGQTKAKFIVVLSTSAADDPISFLLATSEKAKHATAPHPEDFFKIAAGAYPFFSLNTLLDVSEAGTLDISSEEFAALYEAGKLVHKGVLPKTEVAKVISMIKSCPRVSRRFKRQLEAENP